MREQILRPPLATSAGPMESRRFRGIITWLRDAGQRLRRAAGQGAREEKVALLALVLVLAFLSWP